MRGAMTLRPNGLRVLALGRAMALALGGMAAVWAVGRMRGDSCFALRFRRRG